MEQKQNSGLGIAGMIIGIVSILLACIAIGGITGIVGLILSIIALTQKNKKTGISIAGVVLNLIAIMIFIFILCIVNSDNEDTETSTSNTVKTKETIEYVEPEPAPIVKEVLTDDGIINTIADGCTLKYLRHEFKENYSGDKCIAVYYEFTNNSDETASYIYTFSDQAFQNGIELDKSLFLLDDEEDNRSKDIRPGVSVEVYSLFKPQDDSIVELEVSEWISLSDKPLDTMELSLE